MKFYKLRSFILCLLLVNIAFATSPSVKLLSERHRTEWNWVEYRLALTNLSNSTLANPTIRYFAENPKIQYCKAHPNDVSCAGMQFNSFEVDSTLRTVVDDFTIVDSVKPQFYYNSKYTVISLKFFGNIPSQATSTINFRIMRDQYPAWDCSHDYSFQQNANVQEEHYKMAVYDSDGKILWGSDPFALQHDTTNIYWQDRSGTKVISQYDGLDSARTIEGRFWLLKGTPLSFDERLSLDSLGVKLLETARYQNKGLHLLKAKIPIKKKTLNALLSNFFNAFVVDDTTQISLIKTPTDLYQETYICDESDSCSTTISERAAFNMSIECWPDLHIVDCKNIALQCGGDSIYIDRDIILAKIQRTSIQCLANHNDVRFMHLRRTEPLDTYNGRTNINIETLQFSEPKWQQALLMPEMTADWLLGAKYTGEGIVVDVHDDPIDFAHPGFKEINSYGADIPRQAIGFDDARSVIDEKGVIHGHGTHVAGIIGGNGRLSETFKSASLYQYRGVAPKVKFHAQLNSFENERGNVANHSHALLEEILPAEERDSEGEILKLYQYYYGTKSASLDRNIFYNFTKITDRGDNLIKTIVATVGNAAYYLLESGGVRSYSEYTYGWQWGYHSVTDNAKNQILVGSYNKPDLKLSHFSSLGPTWDGRIKPDIMAPGDGNNAILGVERSGIISTIPLEGGNWYGAKAGTSQAAPFVTGVVALMYQKFQQKTGISLNEYSMRNSTTKALLIHSAIDMKGSGSDSYKNKDINAPTTYGVGPDFATGWGRIDAEAALNLIEDYDINSKSFAKFREFSMYNGVQKRWNINVPNGKPSLRTTIVWDDAPGNPNKDNYTDPKLVNDLDLYLISPSGTIYYPWTLKPLSTTYIDNDGREFPNREIQDRVSGLEKITLEEASTLAKNSCTPFDPKKISESCFDRLNNVEVVDINNPDPGIWQVVVKGYRVETGNSPDGRAQIASIVSDFPLIEATSNGNHPYTANTQTSEIIDLEVGCNQINCYLENYVTFGPETSLGEGDHIYLYDGWNRLVGSYTGNSLANQRVLVTTRFLQIVLDSDNDLSQGWGYSISNIEHVPYGVLQVLFSPYKKGE